MWSAIKKYFSDYPAQEKVGLGPPRVEAYDLLVLGHGAGQVLQLDVGPGQGEPGGRVAGIRADHAFVMLGGAVRHPAARVLHAEIEMGRGVVGIVPQHVQPLGLS